MVISNIVLPDLIGMEGSACVEIGRCTEQKEKLPTE